MPRGVLLVWKTSFNLKTVIKKGFLTDKALTQWQQQTVAAFAGLQSAMEALPEAKKLAKHRNVIAYMNSEYLWVQKGVLKRLQNVGGACNELCTCDCTRGVRMDVVVTLGMRWDSIVCLGRAIRCGYDTEKYRMSHPMPALNALFEKKKKKHYWVLFEHHLPFCKQALLKTWNDDCYLWNLRISISSSQLKTWNDDCYLWNLRISISSCQLGHFSFFVC